MAPSCAMTRIGSSSRLEQVNDLTQGSSRAHRATIASALSRLLKLRPLILGQHRCDTLAHLGACQAWIGALLG